MRAGGPVHGCTAANPADLAEAYVNWGGYAYGQQQDGEAAHADFETRLGALEAVVHNQDNREHDLLDSDDYYQFQGGMSAAVATYAGREAAVYHMDHSRPESPRARTLKEEINRVVRSRVLNPKWEAAERLLEAVDRGLWAEPDPSMVTALQEIVGDMDQAWEEGM